MLITKKKVLTFSDSLCHSAQAFDIIPLANFCYLCLKRLKGKPCINRMSISYGRQ